MQNQKNRSFKIIAVVALCIAVLCLSVAYAALAQQLNIRGSASVQAASWDVHFDDFTTEKTGAAQISHTSRDQSTSVSGLTITLTKPGDSATLNFKIHNYGDINAVLTKITGGESGLQCAGSATDPEQASKDAALVCGDLKYEFKWKDNDADVAVNDALPATNGADHSGKAAYIKLTYLSSADDLPSDAVNITGLDRTLLFTQKISADE